MDSRSRNALVTGATGFLGGHLSRRLHQYGWCVTALGRNPTAGQSLASEGLRFIQTDLADNDAVMSACKDQEIVFHAAARSAPWGRYCDFYQDNVLATQNVITACEYQKVSRLVHVSTPSIYFDFTDRFNTSESQIPAAYPANHYVRTKLLAENLVDAASARGFVAITLRPRAIFGPGDTTLFPRLIRAHGSRGFPLIGSDDPIMDITYVENVVDAMLLAADAPAAALGHKFNITNGDPWPRSKLLEMLFSEIGVPLKTRRVNIFTANVAASLLESFSKIFTFSNWEPPLTRYSVGVLSKSQTLDISAARLRLGYTPRVSIKDGLHRFGLWWKKQRHAA